MTGKQLEIDQKASADAGTQRSSQFEEVVQRLASYLGAPRVDTAGTPVSVFRSRHSSVLGRVIAGSVEVVMQSGEPFVILGADQVIALCARIVRPKTAAEILAGLPSVPASPHVPRYRSILNKSHHRVPPEK